MTLEEIKKTSCVAYSNPNLQGEVFFFAGVCYSMPSYRQVISEHFLPTQGYVKSYHVYPVSRCGDNVLVNGIEYTFEEAKYLRDRLNITLGCF